MFVKIQKNRPSLNGWKRLFSLIIAIFFLQISLAQEAKVTSSGKSIKLNEEFRLSIFFPKEFKKEFLSFPYYSFPEIPDLVKTRTIYQEENKGYKLVQTYKALKRGIFEIPEFRATVRDKTIKLPVSTLLVVESLGEEIAEEPTENLKFHSEKEEMVLKILTDKKKIYKGEGFSLSVNFLINQDHKSRFNFIDLHNQAMEMMRNLSPANCMRDQNSKGIEEKLTFDTISIDRKIYKRLKLFEARYYPLDNREIKLPSVNLTLIRYATAEAKKIIYWKSEKITLKTFPVTIKVEELPEHPLKDIVPVGNFQFNDNVSTNVLRTGKSFNYTFMITGDGNLSEFLQPQVKENEYFDFYLPKTKEEFIRKNGKVIAARIFSYKIIPKEPGVYRLSDYFQAIYFNPLEKRYDTLRSSIPVIVQGESLKNKNISSTDLESFKALSSNESNKLRSKERDENIKFFANIIILFMLVTTAILIFKK